LEQLLARQTKQSTRKKSSSSKKAAANKAAAAATSSVSELSLDTDDEIQMIRDGQQQPPSTYSSHVFTNPEFSICDWCFRKILSFP
jgi:hypothetical protein